MYVMHGLSKVGIFSIFHCRWIFSFMTQCTSNWCVVHSILKYSYVAIISSGNPSIEKFLLVRQITDSSKPSSELLANNGSTAQLGWSTDRPIDWLTNCLAGWQAASVKYFLRVCIYYTKISLAWVQHQIRQPCFMFADCGRVKAK